MSSRKASVAPGATPATSPHKSSLAPTKNSIAPTGQKRASIESTMSGMSVMDSYEKPQRRSVSTFLFGTNAKNQGGYTSLFPRKLLPPLGFYREADKYCNLKKKYAGDEDKLEAIEDMWKDYEKYQIRKRFRWPPTLFFNKFFWTTGYYADYQKTHRARRIPHPGDDSSDEELQNNVIGAFLIAKGDHDDINVDEFERYRKAREYKKKRMTWVATEPNENPLEGKSTSSRLFGGGDKSSKEQLAKEKAEKEKAEKERLAREKADKELLEKIQTEKAGLEKALAQKAAMDKAEAEKDKAKGEVKTGANTVEEVETVVEYTVIRNPNKKSRKGDLGNDLTGALHGLSEEEIKAAHDGHVVSKKKSVVKTTKNAETGQIISKTETKHH